jgi:predicted nucleic acid-binding protein
MCSAATAEMSGELASRVDPSSFCWFAVLSALMRDRPDPAVISWLDEQPAESSWITAITVLEIRTGLELLRASRRRTQLAESFDQLLRIDVNPWNAG